MYSLQLLAVHKIACTPIRCLRALRHHSGLSQRRMQHRAEGGVLHFDRAKPGHQSLKESLFLVLIAVMNARTTGMAPDLGGNEKESQAAMANVV